MFVGTIVGILLGLSFLKISFAETEYFPGLRKPPQLSNWNTGNQNENSYLLAQLSNIIEEQARRRFQQQQQLIYQQHQLLQKNFPPLPLASQEIAAPGYTYQFAVKPAVPSNEEIQFGVNPADPRYYQSMKAGASHYPSNFEENYEDLIDKLDEQASVVSNVDGVPSYKLKAPMEVKPKNNVSKTRDDLKSLVEKLQQNGQDNAIINSAQYPQRNEVIKKHIEIDAAVGMYVVALIAGVSAAFTVGLIALGIGWYTLHKKGLAAADVEYPAYGVTGPNKDISPSGDRRLAQSAQMYHYQHQKQQIIAMENRTNPDRNGTLSDVESDDENEEGDYTVYECPGLAPTANMEVKNPLFLEDPTPATPASTTLDAQPKRPEIQTTVTDAKTNKSN